MKNVFVILLVLTLMSYSQNIFEDALVPIANVKWSTSAWCDYNNDGSLDIFLAGQAENGDIVSKLYKNNGNYSFTEITAGIIGVMYGSAAWGDYNNDGYADLLLMGKYNDSTDNFFTISKVYKNNGNGTFTDIGAQIQNMAYGKAIWADLDNDGLLDIFLTGYNWWYSIGSYSEHYTKIYRNLGNDTFVEISTALNDLSGSGADIGDYNNDGLNDIILNTYENSSRVTKIFRNDGNWAFTDINAQIIGVDQGSVSWGDYNSDGLLDVLIAGQSSSGPVSKVYRNDSNVFFTDINSPLTGVKEGCAVWGDYNSDGYLNILLSGMNNLGQMTTELYRYKGNDVFELCPSFQQNIVPAYRCHISNSINTFNRSLDILITGLSSSFKPFSKVYKNKYTGYSHPTSPSNLSFSQKGDRITLAWDKGTSVKTPQDALTYNLYVRTDGNSENIMGCESIIANGKRKITAMGNAFHNTEWTVKDLPNGTYYWSVQTIDNRFIGSSFAAESSFTKITISSPPNPDITYFEAGDVNIVWDEVSNATSYKVFASDDPNGTFADVSSEGTFTGTSWTGTGTGTKRFYYVVAVSE
jgi:hypothetical protein